jgi:DNA polymerase III epsilon subunit-like protein
VTRRTVFIDCETADLDPGPATIWELALILRDGDHVDSEMVWHIRPDVPAGSAMSLGVGGYYERCRALGFRAGSGKLIIDSDDGPGDLARVQSGSDIAAQLAPMLSKATLVGANVGAFDVQHLDAYLRAHGECLAADYHYLEIESLAYGWALARGLPEPSWPLKLTGALRVCGLHPDTYRAHEAIEDARACRDIYDVVMGGPS